jgi:hypothetical protein
VEHLNAGTAHAVDVAHRLGKCAACGLIFKIHAVAFPVRGGEYDAVAVGYIAAQRVACGSAGPANAALLAVQILGTEDAGLREKFRAHKQELATKVAAANARIHEA